MKPEEEEKQMAYNRGENGEREGGREAESYSGAMLLNAPGETLHCSVVSSQVAYPVCVRTCVCVRVCLCVR